MQEHPNATLVRNAIDALNSGDPTTQAELMADDVVWHEIGAAEPIRGKQALIARFAGMPAGGSIRADLHDVVANDEHSVALVTATATMGDKSFTYRTAEICHFRDGKLTERWAFSDDTQRIIEFFSQAGG